MSLHNMEKERERLYAMKRETERRETNHIFLLFYAEWVWEEVEKGGYFGWVGIYCS